MIKKIKKNIDARTLKIIIISIIFTVAHILFGLLLNNVFKKTESWFALDLSSVGEILGLLINIFLISIVGGLLAALINEFKIKLIIYLISSILTILFFKISLFTLLAGFIYLGLGLIYFYLVERKQKNRIKFSIGPIRETQKIFLSALMLMVSLAFAFGYYDKAVNNNYIIPPKQKEMILKSIENTGDGLGYFLQNKIENALENQKTRQLENKDYVNEEDQNLSGEIENTNPITGFNKELEKNWQDFENNLKPFIWLISLTLGFITFISLRIITFVLFWATPYIILGIISIFKKLKIIEISKHQEEVERLKL